MYRLQQRLAITRYEGVAVLTLAGLCLLGLAAKHYLPSGARPDPDAYAKVKARFEAQTAALPGANRPAAHPAGGSTTSTAVEGKAPRIDLNAATAVDLEQLPGLGPTLSRRVVEYRRTHGPFTAVDDIMRIRGIGEKTLARLKDQLNVGVSSAAQ
jgi:competence protein ComEA